MFLPDETPGSSAATLTDRTPAPGATFMCATSVLRVGISRCVQ